MGWLYFYRHVRCQAVYLPYLSKYSGCCSNALKLRFDLVIKSDFMLLVERPSHNKSPWFELTGTSVSFYENGGVLKASKKPLLRTNALAGSFANQHV